MPAQFSYRLTVAAAPLHPSTGVPIMELAHEAHVTISGATLDAMAVDKREMFLALVHDGAIGLWDQEIKKQWCPPPPTSKPTTSPPSSGKSPTSPTP